MYTVFFEINIHISLEITVSESMCIMFSTLKAKAKHFPNFMYQFTLLTTQCLNVLSQLSIMLRGKPGENQIKQYKTEFGSWFHWCLWSLTLLFLGLCYGRPLWQGYVVVQRPSPSQSEERRGGSQGQACPSRVHPNDFLIQTRLHPQRLVSPPSPLSYELINRWSIDEVWTVPKFHLWTLLLWGPRCQYMKDILDPNPDRHLFWSIFRCVEFW